ncbi:NAD(P)-dependent oxidoreductase [Chelatococcus asaccharovorans]|uniref:NAD(P)-dependent oxidoreductase n=1 Tax=Chelatococcus asaccharovorans TaxID=28210 RepID=UPI002B26EE2A|nr:NAD(P)-dependent oxidoreductase [Chelatococcus asaccharovorans]
MTQMTVGFIGVGRMGRPVALRLLAAGHPVIVLPGAQRSTIPELRASGCLLAETPAALAAACDVVVTCLPASATVARVATGPQGLIAAARPGFVHIDLTSGDPGTDLVLAQAYTEKGAAFADVGMSGAPERAETGQLTLMVGATDVIFAEIKPLLEVFSSQCLHLGEIGSGHRAKTIIASYGMAIANATAETLIVARHLGIDLSAIHKVISGSGMNSTTFQTMALAAMGETAQARKLTIGSALKDVASFVAMADAAGFATTIAPATLQSLTRACAAGHAETFVSDLTAVLSDISGHSAVARTASA